MRGGSPDSRTAIGVPAPRCRCSRQWWPRSPARRRRTAERRAAVGDDTEHVRVEALSRSRRRLASGPRVELTDAVTSTPSTWRSSEIASATWGSGALDDDEVVILAQHLEDAHHHRRLHQRPRVGAACPRRSRAAGAEPDRVRAALDRQDRLHRGRDRNPALERLREPGRLLEVVAVGEAGAPQIGLHQRDREAVRRRGGRQVPGDRGSPPVRADVTRTLRTGSSRAKRRFIWSIREGSAICGGRSANGLWRFSARLRGTVVSTGASKAAVTCSVRRSLRSDCSRTSARPPPSSALNSTPSRIVSMGLPALEVGSTPS